MTTEDLTKRIRLTEALLRDRQFELAFVLARRLEDAIATLPADSVRCVPTSVRDRVHSLRSAAEVRSQLA